MESKLKVERKQEDLPSDFSDKTSKAIKYLFDNLEKYLENSLIKDANADQSLEDYEIKNNELNAHKIKCCRCNKNEIFGNVYKCIICGESSIFCEKCSNAHDHPMIKIY